MLKVRITFVDNEKGQKELEALKKILEQNTEVLSESEIYKGRGKSIYSNIYFDIEKP